MRGVEEYDPESGPPSGRTRSQTRGVIQEATSHFLWRPSPAQQPPPPQQTAGPPGYDRLQQQVKLQLEMHRVGIQRDEMTEARLAAVEGRIAAIEHNRECLKGRVEALEVQVFNQTFNNYQPPPGGVGTRRAPGYGRRRLTHRVADLERAAMTIPVGTTVNIVNPGGPLHDDDSDVVNESEVEFYDETSEEDES